MAFSHIYTNGGYSAECDDRTLWRIAAQNVTLTTLGGENVYLFDYTVAGSAYINDTYVTQSEGNSIRAWTGRWGLTATPTAEMPLMIRQVGANWHYPIRVGTDGKLRIYDKNGVQRGPASTSTLQIASLTEVCVIFDDVSAATVWVWIYINGVEDVAFDTGVTPANFWAGGGSVYYWFGYDAVPGGGLGSKLYGRDLIVEEGTAAGDAPHLANYPRLRTTGGMKAPPAAMGADTAWQGSPEATNRYLNIDASELPEHDADSSYNEKNIAAGGANVSETYKSTAANPMPVGATVLSMQLRNVAKTGTAAKTMGANWRWTLAGITGMVSGFGAGASYVGASSLPTTTRPAGGSWQRADADPNTLEWGGRTMAAAGVGAHPRITVYPGPFWVYYTATLPLGTPPGAPSLVIPAPRMRHLIGR